MTDKNKKTVEAYDKNSQYYAKTFDSYGVRSEDIDRALKFNNSGCSVVLELGCANGRDAEYIISKVGVDNYTGIDASERLIALAKQNNPGGTFQVKDMREVSYETESLGIIFSFATMLHVNRDELEALVQKCHKWLKTGGILYISSKYGEYRELEIENLGDEKYYYPYTPEEIKNIAGIGFVVIYSVIRDSDYGPEFVIALKKVTHETRQV